MPNVFINERLIKLKEDKSRLEYKGKDYSYEELVDYDNVGWLIPSGYVIIDFDVLEYGEIAQRIIEDLNIKCIQIITDRGTHFIFKTNVDEFKDWTHKYNFLGLECDAKGNGLRQNKSNYECVKRYGRYRKQILHGGIKLLSEVETLPDFLKMNKNGINLRLSEGDGRNTTLFTYQINLISSGFTKTQAREISKLINKYVFIDSMTDVELETICRDEAYENIKKKDSKKLDLDVIVDEYISQENISTYMGNLVWYINNNYTMDENLMHNRIIELTYGHNTLESTRKEIMLRLKRKTSPTKINTSYIILKNGNLYNLFTGEVIENTVDIKAIHRYDYNIDDNAKGGNVEDFITFLSTSRDGIYREEVRTQLLEMIGCAIAPNTSFQKAFFLKGEGANGKSVLLRVIQSLLGTHATNVSLKEFNNPFSLESMLHGTCNIIDDLGNQRLEDTDIFKQVVGGGDITVQAKNQAPYITRSLCTLIIAGNDYPKMGENSEAIERRLVFIELNNRVKKMNINLVNELCDNEEGLTWLFTKSLEAYKKALERGKLTTTSSYQEAMASYKIISDNVLEFLITKYVPKDKIKYNIDGEIINDDLSDIDIDGKVFTEIYDLYKVWCFEQGFKYPVSTIKFSKQVRHYLEDYYTLIHTYQDGNQVRVYQRKKL